MVKRGSTARQGGQPAAGEAQQNGQASDGTDQQGGQLPLIDADNEDLAAVTRLAWQALRAANVPPVLFRHGAVPSRIEEDDDGAPLVRRLNVDRMRHRLARVACWVKNRHRVPKAASPPVAVVRDVLASPDPPLPVLTRIVEAPTFAADGTLQTTPGYNPRNRTYYAPAPGFEVPPVSQRPTKGEIAEARQLLTAELTGDFPFVGQAERATALACLLLPFLRDAIEGPTPLHLIEAPCPGTGKTLLVDLLTYPTLGRSVAAMSEGRNEDEWRKRIFAKLRGGPSVLLIDNVKLQLESGAVASAITAWPAWEDRLLGVSEIVRVPVRCAWIVTGNNPSVSSEMTRRLLRCRLDAKADRPWLRKEFRHADIRRWARDHRAQLVWAALTLGRAWFAAGRPEGTQTLGMFENWARTLGGILDVAGVPGFLSNLNEFYEQADTELAVWLEFVGAWWDARGHREVKAADLWPLAVQAGMDLGDKGELSQKTRLGNVLSDARDRVFTVPTDACGQRRLRLEAAGESKRAKLWRLKDVT
jgi:hypothetical protein